MEPSVEKPLLTGGFFVPVKFLINTLWEIIVF